MDTEGRGVTAVELGRIRRIRRSLRFILPIVAAAFVAVMCAGPLALSAPGTMQWAQGAGCPTDHHLEVLEVLDISVSPAETRQVIYCVDAQGQGTQVGPRLFITLWLGYFVVLTVVAFGLVYGASWVWQWFFGLPKRPVGWETEREARELVAQGKRAEAETMIRNKTGAGPRWVRRYVEVLGSRGEGD